MWKVGGCKKILSGLAWLLLGMSNYESELAWKMVVAQSIAEVWGSYERHDSPLQFGVCLLALLQEVTE